MVSNALFDAFGVARFVAGRAMAPWRLMWAGEEGLIISGDGERLLRRAVSARTTHGWRSAQSSSATASAASADASILPAGIPCARGGSRPAPLACIETSFRADRNAATTI